GAGGFARDRDLAGIATEGPDVPPHPAQCGDQVEHAVIAGGVVRRFRGELRMGEEAEGVEAVIDRDDDDAPGGEIGAVVARLGHLYATALDLQLGPRPAHRLHDPFPHFADITDALPHRRSTPFRAREIGADRHCFDDLAAPARTAARYGW